MTDFPKDANQARIDRDATRAEMTETLHALAQKLDVKTRARATVDTKLDQATSKVADIVSEPAAARFRTWVNVIRANPLPFFAAIIALLIATRLTHRKSTPS